MSLNLYLGGTTPTRQASGPETEILTVDGQIHRSMDTKGVASLPAKQDARAGTNVSVPIQP